MTNKNKHVHKDFPDAFSEEHPGVKLYNNYTHKYKRLTKTEQAFAKISNAPVYRDYVHAMTYGHQIYNQELVNGGKL